MKPRETLTSLPPSPSAERRSRAIKYSIAMGIRMLCVDPRVPPLDRERRRPRAARSGAGVRVGDPAE
ncbi:DUF3099 domain-containing protein, partial [Rathayibacter sp. AY1D9]|uniref:DUF3099 domain-containing protein n=1 Tax=Rathayibacter sp. AY1D9 TaxID=2080548 RepID=UPI0011B00B36